MRQQDYFDVSQSVDIQALEANLVAFANHMDFGLVSAVLMHGDLQSPDVRVRSVSNTPQAFMEISTSLDEARGDPVMQRLMSRSIPFIYDQRLYADSGAGELWEVQAPFGYCTGIAVGLHLPDNQHFMLGVDRPKRLPRSEKQLTRMLADVQLLAVHAQDAARRLLGPAVIEAPKLPALTPRELECLKWTMEGKSAWAVGQILAISSSAVNFHIQNAMRKLEVSSKHSAVLKCVSLGIL
ncbi:LuxR C-terminal-related transcriptional regulator [Paucibacter sediminis]|uniref:LuxR C-terminal-related transcriptional regulator n=1 Tax=Paucibacter sediminis TaxID=3019553 RepID=A0AA95SRS7_9BURK|nr:LuxR C-terminal-related transcriptional regulator [Paucibacter sp. S2-9]WIT13596.1 LuxR C-terminal-related transcriptional regulator [Paucibacter sp. S2-9]